MLPRRFSLHCSPLRCCCGGSWFGPSCSGAEPISRTAQQRGLPPGRLLSSRVLKYGVPVVFSLVSNRVDLMRCVAVRENCRTESYSVLWAPETECISACLGGEVEAMIGPRLHASSVGSIGRFRWLA